MSTGTKLRNNLEQVVHTYVLLSPSSITWYWLRDGDVLWLGRWLQAWQKVMAAYRRLMTHLRADCLYSGISSGPNAVWRVWKNFILYTAWSVQLFFVVVSFTMSCGFMDYGIHGLVCCHYICFLNVWCWCCISRYMYWWRYDAVVVKSK